MTQTGKKILLFAEQTQRRRSQSGEFPYRCFVTTGRLKGACTLLVCERSGQMAELFYLDFRRRGLYKQDYFYREQQIKDWLRATDHLEITYRQALGVLGDGVRQNYKYQMELDWLKRNRSLHLQRIWNGEFYNSAANNLSWALTGQPAAAILDIYLEAVRNKDAVLLYDLFVGPAKPREQRDVYALHWSHALEEFSIFDVYVAEEREQAERSAGHTLFATLYGETEAGTVLSVDLHLELRAERGSFFISRERVLESRAFYRADGPESMAGDNKGQAQAVCGASTKNFDKRDAEDV